MTGDHKLGLPLIVEAFIYSKTTSLPKLHADCFLLELAVDNVLPRGVIMELSNRGQQRQQQQQQQQHKTFFSLLDDDRCDSAGLPLFGKAMTDAAAVVDEAMASPLPGGEALNDGYDPTGSSSGVLEAMFESFPRCRSNTWHGGPRHAVGRRPVQLPPTMSQTQKQKSMYAIGDGASADDTEEDYADDDDMELASRSTPSTSDPDGEFTLVGTGAGSVFGHGAGLGSSGCGSSTSSITGGYDVCSDQLVGGSTASSAALSAVASRKSTSRRNAWGNLSYADLITRAIESSPDRRLTLSQIYAWLVTNVPFFRDKGENNSSAGWKVSLDRSLARLMIMEKYR